MTFPRNRQSLRRIWTKHGGKSSYKPPGAFYIAQGPQKQPEIMNNYFSETMENQQSLYIQLYSFVFPLKGLYTAFKGTLVVSE